MKILNGIIIQKKKQLFNSKNSRSYKLIDKASAVVFIDSALGYEALARGARVASFDVRKEFVSELKSFNFGYPAKLPKVGVFWTNSIRKKKIVYRILNYVLNTSQKSWNFEKKKYVKEIAHFSKENIELTKVLNNLNV